MSERARGSSESTAQTTAASTINSMRPAAPKATRSKSVITAPSGGQRLIDRGYHEIQGLAWSGRGRIRRVDVSTDGGRNWRTARLQEPVLTKALTRFRCDWQWDGGPALLQSRAIDDTGYVQPTITQLRAVRGTRSIYHNNAIQTWRVLPDGEVGNVQVA